MSRGLEQLFRKYGRPACSGNDNVPELVSTAVQACRMDEHVDTPYTIRSPRQSICNERLSSIFRTTGCTGGSSVHHLRRER
jgi:hypothetical protein